MCVEEWACVFGPNIRRDRFRGRATNQRRLLRKGVRRCGLLLRFCHRGKRKVLVVIPNSRRGTTAE
jgi:hypothetical protein